MNTSDNNESFDQDFLWLFGKIEYPAICLSLNHHIIDVTPSAETLFSVSKKDVLHRPISALVEHLGLKITLVHHEVKTHTVNIYPSDSRITSNTDEIKSILRLYWQVKSKIDADKRTVGIIIFAEERTDLKYLDRLYHVVNGKEEPYYNSTKGFAENIKIYLENIIACMPGSIYWMDRNCIYLGANDNCAKLLGLTSRQEVVGKTYEDIERITKWMHKKTASWKRDDQEVIKTGKSKLNIEEPPIVFPDGKIVYYLTNRVPLFDAKKNVIGMVGVSTDITEHKLMETALKKAIKRAEKAEHEQQQLLIRMNLEITGQKYDKTKTPAEYVKNMMEYLENIIACMPGNVFWMDQHDTCLGCNDNFAQFIGLPKKEIIGMTYEKMKQTAKWMAGQTRTWQQDDAEIFATGKPKINIEESSMLLPNGRQVLYLTNRVPLFDDKRNVIAVVCVSLDITDRKKAEQALHEAIIREEVQEEKIKTAQSLGGAVAHELRTPLRSITSTISGISKFLPRLIESYQLACRAKLPVENIQPRHLAILKNTLDSIKHETNFANMIIDMLLMNIREIKISPEELENCSAVACIDEALQRYPFSANEKQLIHWQQPNDNNDFNFKGKKLLIVHVLFNLIKNALYHIAKAGKGEVSIWLEHNDNDSEKINTLHFKDTGTGIPNEVLTKIFDHFFTRTHGGTGIGLSFCKMVMNGLGGNIICQSVEGEFTEFLLTFPTM